VNGSKRIPCRGELDGSIETEFSGRTDLRGEALDLAEKGVPNSRTSGLLPPDLCRAAWLRKLARPIHEQEGSSVDAEITGVSEHTGKPLAVDPVVLGRVALRHQEPIGASSVGAVPAPRPILVGPAQAEREVGFSSAEGLVQRKRKEPPPGEPIVVVAERVDVVGSSQIGLRTTRFRVG
jgi:hypothetical protein